MRKTLDHFGEELKFKLAKMHEQFKIKMETDHANELAKEVDDVYCQLSTTKKNQAIILSQTNGLLAASAIGLPVDGPFILTQHVSGNHIL